MTEPSARSDGIGAKSPLKASRSERQRTLKPSRTARAASVCSLARLAFRPSAPSERGKTASRVRKPSTSLRRISSSTPSESTGLESSSWRQGTEPALVVQCTGERPRYVVSDIAPPSRYGSIGGLVTSAKVCCRYLKRVWCCWLKIVSTRSKPMEPSGSFLSFAISLTKTARSNSQPWAWRSWSMDHDRPSRTLLSGSSTVGEKSKDSGMMIWVLFSS